MSRMEIRRKTADVPEKVFPEFSELYVKQLDICIFHIRYARKYIKMFSGLSIIKIKIYFDFPNNIDFCPIFIYNLSNIFEKETESYAGTKHF